MVQKTKNKKIYNILKILTITAIILILLIMLLNKFALKEKNSKLKTELSKDTILVNNEILSEEHIYSFELENRYNETKECWVTIKIAIGSKITPFKNQYIGYIKPNQSVPISMSLDGLPHGKAFIAAVPDCKDI